jgi:multisubunit Na+/H+ antiporter MnhE subunit
VKLPVLMVLAFAAVSVIVSGDPSWTQAIVGVLFGTLFVLAAGAGRGHRVPLSTLPQRFVLLLLYLVVIVPLDLMWSNAALAWRLARPTPAIRPGIARLRLDRSSDTVLGIEQHALTLSPGQMLIEHDAQSGATYVHFMDVEEAEARNRTLRRVSERVFRGVFR